RRPGRITPGEADHTFEQRRVLRYLDLGPEQPCARRFLPRLRELGDEGVHRLEQGRVAVVRLSAGASDVPPVDNDLVQCDQTGDLARERAPPAWVMPDHAAGSRQASASAARSCGIRVRQSSASRDASPDGPWDVASPKSFFAAAVKASVN